MTGLRFTASVACSVVVLGMTAAHAADASRTRSGSSSAAQATAAGNAQSLTEYMELISDGGALAGGPALLGEFKTPTVARPTSNVGRGGQNGQDCAREPFPCGVYEDRATFDAEQGPFSRALGNHEDFNLVNVNAGNFCSVANPPADCAQHAAGTGSCQGGLSLNAGDILPGLNIINNPFRNNNNETVEFGTGFNGNSSQFIMANYFGDSYNITFPTTGGCAGPNPGPNVFGADFLHPFGTTGARITVTLTNGRTLEYTTGFIGGPSTGGDFVGFCCEAPIQQISATDIDGIVIGTDNNSFRVGDPAQPCPVSFPPLTLEDINCAIESIEAKLDNFQGGGSGGGCDFCEAEIDAVQNPGAESRLRHRRDQACKAELAGRGEAAQHHRCQMGSEIDSQESGGGIDAAEATALRACLAAEQANRSDDPCN